MHIPSLNGDNSRNNEKFTTFFEKSLQINHKHEHITLKQFIDDNITLIADIIDYKQFEKYTAVPQENTMDVDIFDLLDQFYDNNEKIQNSVKKLNIERSIEENVEVVHEIRDLLFEQIPQNEKLELNNPFVIFTFLFVLHHMTKNRQLIEDHTSVVNFRGCKIPIKSFLKKLIQFLFSK